MRTNRAGYAATYVCMLLARKEIVLPRCHGNARGHAYMRGRTAGGGIVEQESTKHKNIKSKSYILRLKKQNSLFYSVIMIMIK